MRRRVEAARRERILEANAVNRLSKDHLKEQRRSMGAFEKSGSVGVEGNNSGRGADGGDEASPGGLLAAALVKIKPRSKASEATSGRGVQDSGSPSLLGSASSPEAELLTGVSRGNLRLVRRALNAGASLERENPRGTTLLMLACTSHSAETLEVVKALLLARSDMGGRDYQGWNCLHFACRNGDKAVASLLLGSKAQLVPTSDHKTPLMLACWSGNTDMVMFLLDEKGVHSSIHETDTHGQAALHFACISGRDEIVREVVKFRGKVSAKDRRGRQPMHIASEMGRNKVVKLFVGKGADPGCSDDSNRTPLHLAVLAGHESTGLLLVSSGASADVESEDGETPFSLAARKGLTRFVREVERIHWEMETKAAEAAENARKEQRDKERAALLALRAET